jgi:hypothetical protein
MSPILNITVFYFIIISYCTELLISYFLLFLEFVIMFLDCNVVYTWIA